MLGPKNIWSEKILNPKKFWVKKFGSKKFRTTTILGPQKIIRVLDSAPKQSFHPQIPLKVKNDTLALQIETILVLVGSARSNCDYKAISASRQSLSLGLSELGNIRLQVIDLHLSENMYQEISTWKQALNDK